MEAQQHAELERQVADQSCEEFRVALQKTKEAHDLAMQTMRELKLTDPHRELREANEKLTETLRKLTDTELTLKHTKAQLDELTQTRDKNLNDLQRAKRFAAAQAARLDEKVQVLDETKTELRSAQFRLDF